MQKQGESRLRSCLALLGIAFGRAQESLFLGGRLVFQPIHSDLLSLLFWSSFLLPRILLEGLGGAGEGEDIALHLRSPRDL